MASQWRPESFPGRRALSALRQLRPLGRTHTQGLSGAEQLLRLLQLARQLRLRIAARIATQSRLSRPRSWLVGRMKAVRFQVDSGAFATGLPPVA